MFNALYRVFFILQITSFALSIPLAWMFMADIDAGDLIGFAILAAILPSITGWILILGHVTQRKTRKQIEESLLAHWKYSEEEWNDWIAFQDEEGKSESLFLAIGFFIAGIGISVIGLIPVPWWQGAIIGAILALFTVFLRKLITQGYRFSNSEEARQIKMGVIGAIVGYITHYWHKDDGEVLEMRWIEETKTLLPIFLITYVRTTYNKNTGTQRNPQHLKIPVPIGEEEKVNSWIREFEKSISA